jgi:ferredoxin
MAGQKLRIKVMRTDCIGDGACCDDAPGTFEMDLDGFARVKAEVTDQPELILKSARACPTDAIVVVDEETGEKLAP